jgi:hypothetical protein
MRLFFRSTSLWHEFNIPTYSNVPKYPQGEGKGTKISPQPNHEAAIDPPSVQYSTYLSFIIHLFSTRPHYQVQFLCWMVPSQDHHHRLHIDHHPVLLEDQLVLCIHDQQVQPSCIMGHQFHQDRLDKNLPLAIISFSFSSKTSLG